MEESFDKFEITQIGDNTYEVKGEILTSKECVIRTGEFAGKKYKEIEWCYKRKIAKDGIYFLTDSAFDGDNDINIAYRDSRCISSPIAINSTEQKISMSIGIYLDKEGNRIDVTSKIEGNTIEDAIRESYDYVFTLVKLRKLTISNFVYSYLENRNRRDEGFVNKLKKLQNNINIILSSDKIDKIKEFLINEGVLETGGGGYHPWAPMIDSVSDIEDYDYCCFNGELCVIKYRLDPDEIGYMFLDEWSIIVNRKGNIITNPCNRVLLLSDTTALCTFLYEKELYTTSRCTHLDTIVDKQIIVNQDGNVLDTVNFGDVVVESKCGDFVVLKRARFDSSLERDQIEFYAEYGGNCNFENIFGIEPIKCPECGGPLEWNEEKSSYGEIENGDVPYWYEEGHGYFECRDCGEEIFWNEDGGYFDWSDGRKSISRRETDDFVKFFSYASLLHILSALNFSEAFEVSSDNPSFMGFLDVRDNMSCYHEYESEKVDDSMDILDKYIYQEQYSVYDSEKGKFLFPFQPNPVIIKGEEMCMKTETGPRWISLERIRKKDYETDGWNYADKNGHSMKNYDEREYNGTKRLTASYFDGQVAEHIDYTFIDGPCVGLTLLEAIKKHPHRLYKYIDSGSLQICNSAIDELIAVCGKTKYVDGLIYRKDKFFNFGDIKSSKTIVTGNIWYKGLSNDGRTNLVEKCLHPFYDCLSFSEVFRIDPEYILSYLRTHHWISVYKDAIEGLPDADNRKKLQGVIDENYDKLEEEEREIQEEKWEREQEAEYRYEQQEAERAYNEYMGYDDYYDYRERYNDYDDY